MEDEDDKLCTTLTVLSAYMLQHINMLWNDTTVTNYRGDEEQALNYIWILSFVIICILTKARLAFVYVHKRCMYEVHQKI